MRFSLGNLVNNVTAPLGVRLFPGGPYPDRGLGDQQLAQADAMRQGASGFMQGATTYAPVPSLTTTGFAPGRPGRDPLTDAMRQGLRGVSPPRGAAGGLPDLQTLGLANLPGYAPLSEMGALSELPGLMELQRQYAGLGSSDPYALSGAQAARYSGVADQLNQGRAAALSSLRQQLAARGITDPRAIAAAEAQINVLTNAQLAGQRAALQQEAFNTRMGTLSDLQKQIMGAYGAQEQRRLADTDTRFRQYGAQEQRRLADQASAVQQYQLAEQRRLADLDAALRMMFGSAGIYGDQAQAAERRTNQAYENLGDFIALGMNMYPGVFGVQRALPQQPAQGDFYWRA